MNIETFLTVIAVVGTWNLINFLGRIYYKEIEYTYCYHIVLGGWAAYFLYIQ